MRTSYVALLITFLCGVCFPTVAIAPVSGSSMQTGVSWQCLDSFQKFAYTLERNVAASTKPSYPWVLTASVPETNRDGKGYPVSVVLAQDIGGKQQIWFSLEIYDEHENFKMTGFEVYDPKSDNWSYVSGRVGDTDFMVKKLFVTSDGHIWGQIDAFSSNLSLPSTSKSRETTFLRYPLLALFNGKTGRFEVPTNTMEISLLSDKEFPFTHVMADNDDNFWIFVEADGLYHYDPAHGFLEKVLNLPKMVVSNAVVSPDGSIYFENGWAHVHLEDGYNEVKLSTLFEFDPKTRVLKKLPFFEKSWPMFNGMLFDHKGRLWLGSTGYRDTNNKWVLIHPNPEEYFRHGGDISWSPVTLMLETTDGRLWYRKYTDGGFQTEGAAWYDPESGEGCMFTNYSVIIMADAEERLWMNVGREIYSYKIKQ